MSTFDQTTAVVQDRATIHPTWAQGRAAFGGVGAALALRAAESLSEGRPLRAVQLSFNGPLAPGEASVQAKLLRTGRSATQVQAEVYSGELAAISLLATYGEPRSTAVQFAAPSAPAGPGPDDCFEMPYMEGITPTFTQHFQYRWANQNLPFSGSKEARTDGYVRFRQPTAPDAAALLALIDAWPATVLGLMTSPAPASTMTWMVTLHGLPSADPEAWYRYVATTTAAGGGYADVDARLFGPSGELLASSRQLVAEFSKA